MKIAWHKNTSILDNRVNIGGRISQIGVIIPVIGKPSIIPLSNLVDILSSLQGELYLIIGYIEGVRYIPMNKKVHTYLIEHRVGGGVSARAVNYLWTQLRISRRLMKLSRNVDSWIFFLGGECSPLPVLAAKLLRKRVVIAVAGSGLKVHQIRRDPFVKVLAFFQSITYRLSDRIILYSTNLIKEWNLEKYQHKISIAQQHFLDLDKFRVQKPIKKRCDLIGYIGRLSEEKGVLNFVEAIAEISKGKDAVRFVIGGDGQLRHEIGKYLDKENLNGKVKLPGWIPQDEFIDYLNELKLLILPSYTEGLPNIVIQAMACGTPVLATSVGTIPDVIKDGKTGFIMQDNSPECIARNVIRALNHPNIEEITKNARAFIEKEFTYEKAVEGYRKILNDITQVNMKSK